MATVAIKTSDEVKVRELIDHWANAARTSDLDGIVPLRARHSGVRCDRSAPV